jgi:hypothetical protein
MSKEVPGLRLLQKYGVDTSNFHQLRKDRARRLCGSLGKAASYVPQDFRDGTKLTCFSSFDEAVEDLTAISESKGIVFLIYEVTKIRSGGWGICYKTSKTRDSYENTESAGAR